MAEPFAPLGALLRSAGACAAGCLEAKPLLAQLEPERAAQALERLPGLRSLLCAAFPYATGREPEGPFSRYARGEDYHAVLRRRLEPVRETLETAFPGNRFLYYADVSPFPEVRAAALAGLGKLGQNGLLITETAGSYVFLAFLATDLAVCPTGGALRFCRGCGECLRQCPAGALPGGGTVLSDRCLSAVTQRRGPLTEEEQRLVRRCRTLWGCDRCQQCCPENAAAAAAPLPELLPQEPALEPEDLALSDRAFRRKYAGRAFVWRGAAPLRRNAALLGLLPKEKDQKERRKER